MSLRVAFAILLFATAPFALHAETAAHQPLSIIRVSPDGQDVPAGKQIVIQFNRAVVPLGRMEREAKEIPVTITPELPCEWRWINTSALACNLPDAKPLQESTKYTLTIKPGILTEDGATIVGDYSHNFITQRPAIVYKSFRVWKNPGLPVVLLLFNQPVEKESVAEHVYFMVNGSGKVAAKVTPSNGSNEQPPVTTANKREARSFWLVEPVKDLPANTRITVKMEPGIVSANGPEKSATESDIVAFDTYPEFAFLGVKCRTNDGAPITIAPGSRPNQKCNPQDVIQLSFSAPVRRSQITSMLEFSPAINGMGTENEEDWDGNTDDTSRIPYEYTRSHEQGNTYDVWLPQGLKAATEYSVKSRAENMGFFARLWHRVKSIFTHIAPIDMRDIFGRELQTPIIATFATNNRNPNVVLDYSDAVLEQGVDSEVPLYVNNLKNYRFDYRSVTATQAKDSQQLNKPVPFVQDVQFAVPLGVREMLGGASGALYGCLTTDPVLPQKNREDCLFAQVTPYQVHFKYGHFNSIAWVTDFATGQPVQGVKVSIYKDAITGISAMHNALAQAVTDTAGIAHLPGTETLDPDLNIAQNAYQIQDTRLFLRAEKGDDLALMPLSYSYRVNDYSVGNDDYIYPVNRERYGHMHAWGTTAQGIYRAGDTIQYKIFVRGQDANRFTPAPTKGYRLKIIDPMGKVVSDQKDVTLSNFGGISGEFTVPKEAAVGWYRFKLIAGFANDASSYDDEQTGDLSEATPNKEDDTTGKKFFTPMRVLVSDFTPSAFKVSTQLNGDLFHANQDVQAATLATLHSGGAYTQASARVTATLDSTPFTSKNPVAKNFTFSSFEEETTQAQIFQKTEALNDKGELNLSFTTGTPKVVHGKLTVESAVSDDRGKSVASQATADYVGVDRLVGLRNTSWLYNVGKQASIEYLVVDGRGTPVKGTDVAIAIEHQVTKSARVKSAGNAYTNDYHNEWEQVDTCKGISAMEAQTCSFMPKKSGTYRAVAKIKDSKGNQHTTTIQTYATGSDFVVWNDENDSTLIIVPENTNYKVGDTARYLIKNPYPGAKALITVERFGIIDSFVQTLEGSTPVVEFPIKPDYIPGFYLSVNVMSPRVEKPLGEGHLDLGKPAFRMGYISVPVSDPYKEMLVTAKADKDVYKPREKVTLSLHAEPRTKDRKEPIELTIAVLDESVLDLIAAGKDYFDPYKGFYKLADLDITNYSLLSRLVGRQKFEKKGANPGGDGGADLGMRSVFKFVSYWTGALKVDAAGNATISFDAPDNLTGWRVLAIATTPTDRFGLGEANFKVNKPTEIRPVLPNQVMERDSFDAGFSVMNRTDKPREIDISITAEGAIDTGETSATIHKKVTLEAFKRTTVFLPVKVASLPVKREIPQGEIRFKVTAGDAADRDGLLQTMPVLKQRSTEVAANYGTTTEDMVTESIDLPKDALADSGNISVVASPTVIGNLAGAFAYMRDYPYICWEQKLSKGIMAAKYKALKAYLPDTLVWQGSDNLTQATLDQAAGFQAPNGGMTFFLAQDTYVDPYLSAYTALAFHWLKQDGYTIPETVEAKLHAYLNTLLKNDAVPDFYSEGMKSSVRAVALAALAQEDKLTLVDMERYRPHVTGMSLMGKTHYLIAALHVKGAEAYAEEVTKMILSHASETAGKFSFNEKLDDGYSRLLSTPLRENCMVLDAFTTYAEHEEGKKLVGDVPFKLLRSITQSRGKRDHWENTQENMFCMNAINHFARVYEKDKPSMKVTASLDDTPFGTAQFNDVRDATATLETPLAAKYLGEKAEVTIERAGTGRLYYATRLTYAMPVEQTKPANAGMELRREYSVERGGKWELLKAPFAIKRGELVRVDLYLSLPTARNFVVVDDSVPGGLEPVNRDLATASKVDSEKGDFKASDGAYWFKISDWVDYGFSRWSFYHQEIRHDSVRYYSDYLPAGNYHLSYTAQAVATGNFSALPTKAEEMYDPDVFGRADGAAFTVAEPEAPKP